jgi:hypothetical protein
VSLRSTVGSIVPLTFFVEDKEIGEGIGSLSEGELVQGAASEENRSC